MILYLRQMNDFLLFSGTSHPTFASEVASYLKVEMGHVAFTPFPDGEIRLAQRQLETDQLLVQEDAASLARALGEAHSFVQRGQAALRSLPDNAAREAMLNLAEYVVTRSY